MRILLVFLSIFLLGQKTVSGKEIIGREAETIIAEGKIIQRYNNNLQWRMYHIIYKSRVYSCGISANNTTKVLKFECWDGDE
jgi:hypothetical protein